MGQTLKMNTKKIARIQSVYVNYNNTDGMNAVILPTVLIVKGLEMMSSINGLQF